jgi:Flp pilus assembly protein TadG
MQKKRSLQACTNGASLMEFGLILPLLMLILFGTLELARFALIHQKLDKLANAMADFATQGTSICTGDLDGYASATPQIMRPFDFSGTIIFSSIIHFNNGVPPCVGENVSCISWQAKRLGNDNSQIGSEGGNANLPSGYTVTPGQNVIATEVYMNFTPMLSFTGTLIPALGDQQIYKTAVFKPRQRNLTVLGNCG